MNKCFLILFLILGLNLNAQQYGKAQVSEIGFGLGTANYLGDLGGTGDQFDFSAIEAKAFRPAFSVFYRNNISKWFAFKADFSFLRIYGHDKFNANAQRNLHFRTNVGEISMQGEWNWLPYKIGAYNRHFTPYIGAGMGVFFFNPKAELNGDWVNLQALGTEGQGLLEYPERTKYSKIGIAFPMSFGFKWHVGERFGFGLEGTYRFIFTDYLDDVSTVYPDLDFYSNNNVTAVAQEAAALSFREIGGDPGSAAGRGRGNPDDDDVYFSILFRMSYRIGQGHVVCPSLK